MPKPKYVSMLQRMCTGLGASRSDKLWHFERGFGCMLLILGLSEFGMVSAILYVLVKVKVSTKEQSV